MSIAFSTDSLSPSSISGLITPIQFIKKWGFISLTKFSKLSVDPSNFWILSSKSIPSSLLLVKYISYSLRDVK